MINIVRKTKSSNCTDCVLILGDEIIKDLYYHLTADSTT